MKNFVRRALPLCLLFFASGAFAATPEPAAEASLFEKIYFGAIAQGVHRFCQFDSGRCEGMADFVIVWRQQGERWQITRVLSYGHRRAEPAIAPAPALR